MVCMKTLMICGGAPPSKELFERIRFEFAPDCLIAVDYGAAFLFECGVTPDLLVGDFDSIDENILEYYQTKCEIIGLREEKDETDSEVALRIAAERGTTQLVLLGATGGRIDHTVANMYLLIDADRINIFAKMIDQNQEIFIISDHYEFLNMQKHTVSLLPASDIASAIRTEGFYYPLYHEDLKMGDVRGMSNMIISQNASVSVEKGCLFCIINYLSIENEA